MVTPGQSPRTDILPAMIEVIGQDVLMIEKGAVDGLSLEEVRSLSPTEEMARLCTRLSDGTQVVVAKEPDIKKKELTVESYSDVLNSMDMSERRIFEKLIEEKGSMLQSLLIRHTGYSKVKMTRILDKLEQKDLIDRKRRGMTNIVMIKQ